MLPAFLIVAALSYLLGSIPFGYLLVRIFRGEDVRQSGSGNIGATNVSRKSPALGVATLLLDALKGSAAVWLMYRFAPTYPLMSLAALLAVLGHIFPVWLHFRGGKGVATGLGSFALIDPKDVLIAICLFIAVTLIFRYVSLASILSVATFALLLYRRDYGTITMSLITATSLLIIARHQDNIRRLLAGTENRLGGDRA